MSLEEDLLVWYPTIPGMGHLSHVPRLDGYFYYDGPHLIQLKSESGQDFLAALVEQDNQEKTMTWVYVTVSAEQLAAFWDDQVDLETIFADPSAKAWRHQVDYSRKSGQLKSVTVETTIDLDEMPKGFLGRNQEELTDA